MGCVIPRTWSSFLIHNHTWPERVPVTKKLLSSVRSAHAAYRHKCEKEIEENERRRKEKEKEAEIARRQKEMDALKAKNASLLQKERAVNERERRS